MTSTCARPWETVLKVRPYLPAILLVLALVVAGAGAALSHPAFPVQPDLGDAAADALLGEAASVPSGPSSAVPPAAPVGSPTAGPPRPSASPTSAARPVSRTERMENEVTALVNIERAKDGCTVPVRLDVRLRAAARAHSADMAANDYFSHTGQDGSSPWDRARRAGYTEASGENIAYGYRTAADVMRGWMNSPGHRANILNCSSRATGVGLAYQGSTAYWTQLFGRA